MSLEIKFFLIGEKNLFIIINGTRTMIKQPINEKEASQPKPYIPTFFFEQQKIKNIINLIKGLLISVGMLLISHKGLE